MPQAAVFNLFLLRDLTDGNAELEAELVRLFGQTARKCLMKLQALAMRDEHDEWDDIIHELKGAASNLQAAQLAEICKTAEKLPMDSGARMDAVSQIKQAYQRLKPLLAELGPLQ